MSSSPTAVSGRERLFALFALLVLLSAIALSWLPYRPAVVRDATAPPATFSAARAQVHLAEVAREPHPPGSAAHAAVRRYLVAQIEKLGLTPELQTSTQTSPRNRWMNIAATTANVLVRVKGSGGGSDAVLLVAHYDSVATGPGANDNGVGVVALLEVLRALTVEAPRHDVIVLFSDAEEEGLFGAQAFAASHAWAKDVKLVINLEARGAGGPALLFETSAGNRALVDAFRRAVPGGVGSSLFYEIYRRLPNDTDYSIFKQSGAAGLNFAYIAKPTAYHSAIDDIASVDASVLQQHGDYALGMTRLFGSEGAGALRADGNAVFFNLPLAGLVAHSDSLALPFALVAALLGVTGLVVAVRRGRARVGRSLVSALALSLLVAVVAGLATLIWLGLDSVLPSQRWMPMGEPYAGCYYFAGLLAVVAALFCGGYGRLRRRFSAEELIGGGLLLWAILAVALGVTMPGASYLATWPLIASALALLARLIFNAGGVVAVLLLAVVPVVVLAPVVYLLYLGLMLPAIVVPSALAALLLVLLLPALELLRHAAPRALVLLPLLAGLLTLAATALLSSFDARHPRPDSLFYVLNADAGRATWASSDGGTDEWTRHFLGNGARRAPLPLFGAMNYPFLQGDAPVSALERPQIEVLSQSLVDGQREVRLRLRSARGADQLWVTLPAELEITAASVNAVALPNVRPGKNRPWSLRYVGLPQEGVELVVRVTGDAAFPVQAVDRTGGLPALPETAAHPRPANTMPTLRMQEFQNATFVAGAVTVPARTE